MPYRLLIEGEGPPPQIAWLSAPVLPPPPPPPPPLPPPPPTPETPFEWPGGGPMYAVRDYERTYHSWRIPGTDEYLYVMEPSAGNPLIARYRNAGIIQRGAYAGLRLWAPPDAPPLMLRAIIATGQWP